MSLVATDDTDRQASQGSEDDGDFFVEDSCPTDGDALATNDAPSDPAAAATPVEPVVVLLPASAVLGELVERNEHLARVQLEWEERFFLSDALARTHHDAVQFTAWPVPPFSEPPESEASGLSGTSSRGYTPSPEYSMSQSMSMALSTDASLIGHVLRTAAPETAEEMDHQLGVLLSSMEKTFVKKRRERQKAAGSHQPSSRALRRVRELKDTVELEVALRGHLEIVELAFFESTVVNAFAVAPTTAKLRLCQEEARARSAIMTDLFQQHHREVVGGLLAELEFVSTMPLRSLTGSSMPVRPLTPHAPSQLSEASASPWPHRVRTALRAPVKVETYAGEGDPAALSRLGVGRLESDRRRHVVMEEAFDRSRITRARHALRTVAVERGVPLTDSSLAAMHIRNVLAESTF